MKKVGGEVRIARAVIEYQVVRCDWEEEVGIAADSVASY